MRCGDRKVELKVWILLVSSLTWASLFLLSLFSPHPEMLSDGGEKDKTENVSKYFVKALERYIMN